MNLPKSGDYIDIHIHEGKPASGVFLLESLMAHETRIPHNSAGIAFTYGIHPWFLNESNAGYQLDNVRKFAGDPLIAAIGEAGFDRLKGPATSLQRKIFEEQVALSEELKKPLIIHCVKGWDDLLAVKKSMNPLMPWLIHGFRGSITLADQLLSKGLYLSVWFDFVLRPESGDLIKHLPGDRFFLETDGADVIIADIYYKVAADRGITVEHLKQTILENFNQFFS